MDSSLINQLSTLLYTIEENNNDPHSLNSLALVEPVIHDIIKAQESNRKDCRTSSIESLMSWMHIKSTLYEIRNTKSVEGNGLFALADIKVDLSFIMYFV